MARNWMIVGTRSVIFGCIALAAALSGIACGSDLTGPRSRAPSVVVRAEWVTGMAAAALDSSGSFVYPPAPFAYISPSRADSVARAVVSFLIEIFGPVDAGGIYASDRGGPVHFSSLRTCERQVYVHNATGPLPAEVDSGIRRFVGSQYVRAMCNAAGEAELSIEVGDGPSSLTILANEFMGPVSGGGEWHDFALRPTPLDRGLPVSAELAVAVVAQATGVRITMPPEALQAYTGGRIMARLPALCMMWHLAMERPVRVRGVSGTLMRSDLYVRRTGACGLGPLAIWVATDSQPSTVSVPLRPFTGGAAMPDSVALPIRFPILFEEVVPVP